MGRTALRWFLAVVAPASVAAVAAFLVSSVASAQVAGAGAATVKPSYAFDMPEGWGIVVRVGTELRFRPSPDRAAHEMAITVATSQSDLEAYAAHLMADARGRGESVVDEGVTTSCDGRPAHRWTARGNSTGVPLVVHVLATAVTGGVGVVSYTRAADAADRSDAMASLTSLCPAPFATPVIAGWKPEPTAPVGIIMLNAPDGRSTFFGSFRRLAHDRFPSSFRDDPEATVVKRWNEECAEGELVRTDLRSGPTAQETVFGYLRGYAYKFTYQRPADREPDPGAEGALTAICHAPPATPLATRP